MTVEPSDADDPSRTRLTWRFETGDARARFTLEVPWRPFRRQMEVSNDTPAGLVAAAGMRLSGAVAD
jgi:hypothetical protein